MTAAWRDDLQGSKNSDSPYGNTGKDSDNPDDGGARDSAAVGAAKVDGSQDPRIAANGSP